MSIRPAPAPPRRYLDPLADHPQIAPHLRLGTRVVTVSRRGLDVMKSDGRAESSFVALLRSSDGSEELVEARAVIDASGTWATPNPLGASGLPASARRVCGNASATASPT